MTDLDRGKMPDSKWFWALLLLAMLVVVVVWFANPLGSMKQPPAGMPASQSTPVDPAEAASPTVPLTLPKTPG
ncbi:hypothetical protein [Novosphingobium sp.]|uniref:hypothetical protein n=1 Tax=Novosphingobium sp. TaxID=1874826 RepID=UPI00333FC0D5